MRTLAFALTATVLLALAPAASGHGIVRKTGGVITYSAPDPGVGAMLSVTSPRQGKVVFHDTASPGGIDWGPCFPVNQRKAECSARSITRIEIDLYDGDDVVIAPIAIPLVIDAGTGDDRIEGGYGRDVLDGGPGNDSIAGGESPDSVVGDSGADLIDVRDGMRDPFSCGSGADSVSADRSDSVPFLLECESVSVANPPRDTSAPKAKIRGSQAKLGRKLRIKASIGEPGTINLAGALFAGKRELGRLGKARAQPDALNQVWALEPRLTRQTLRRARAAEATGARLRAVLELKLRDDDGNRRRQRTAIRLG